MFCSSNFHIAHGRFLRMNNSLRIYDMGWVLVFFLELEYALNFIIIIVNTIITIPKKLYIFLLFHNTKVSCMRIL